jgi:NosR/NirI family nitrous oxide reductase transcriptional regulator
MSPAIPTSARATTRQVLGWAIRISSLVVLLLVAGLAEAAAQSQLARYLPDLTAAELIADADGFGAVTGDPPIAPILKAGAVVGYAYVTSDFVNTVGYSGKPIDIVVALDTAGTIIGARLLMHHEPIVLIGIPESEVADYIAGYIGFNPLRPTGATGGRPDVDIVSGATVTVLVIGDSLMRSAARVAARVTKSPDIAVADQAREIDPDAGEIMDWAGLVGNGAVRRLHLTIGDVNAAFEKLGDHQGKARPEKGAAGDTFIDLYVGLASHPAIGRSLLGEAGFKRLQQRLGAGQSAILVMGDGRYSFKGSGYVRGGIFDRVELVQGTETVRFRDKQHERIGAVAAAGAPAFKEIALFVVPSEVTFNVTDTWSLQLLVARATGALSKVFSTFAIDYRLPDLYTKPASPPSSAATVPTVMSDATATADAASATPGLALEPPPLWQRAWQSKIVSIGVLVVMLLVLTAIFFFQDILVKHEKLFDRVRLGFLAMTLFWLGWVAQAQLSVVNVLTFASAVRADFQWSNFMLDPLVFILWFAVAASLIFWGRGPFCGWLCPFGALQELANRFARLVRIPQIKLPWAVHERLWPIKYIIFLVLFGISLSSLALAEQLAEIEPFKTAIILRFMREWWFVLFALLLIAAGLFVERFFCRYLCPLGAALAIPGRMRMFDWLKRYRECGNPCRRCYNECPVEAIHPEGHINPNECISCLHCQVLYHHDRKCPVVIQRRLKREKRAALSSPGMTAVPKSATGGAPQ